MRFLALAKDEASVFCLPLYHRAQNLYKLSKHSYTFLITMVVIELLGN